MSKKIRLSIIATLFICLLMLPVFTNLFADLGATPDSEKTHIVKKGDTLANLSFRYYTEEDKERGAHWIHIYEYNVEKNRINPTAQPIIKYSKKNARVNLWVGQKLLIPYFEKMYPNPETILARYGLEVEIAQIESDLKVDETVEKDRIEIKIDETVKENNIDFEIDGVAFKGLEEHPVEEEEKENKFELTILHTNDTHGHPVAFFEYPAPNIGGMPARATLVNQIRTEEENVLVLDAGDVLTGRPESNFFNAEPDIVGMNYIDYDAMTIGNHEFDNGMDNLRKLKAIAKFPFLSANIFTKGGEPVFTAFKIFYMNGYKVAVFGLTTHETPEVTMPEYVKNLEFRNPVEIAKKLVPALENKADVIIALTHLGFYPDNENMMSYEGDVTLLKEVPEIDIVIGGHSHTFTEQPKLVNETIFNSAGQWGMYLGRVDISLVDDEIKYEGGRNIPINHKKRIKPGQEIPLPDKTEWIIGDDPEETRFQYIEEPIDEDGELKKTLQEYVEKVDDVLNTPITTAVSTFSDEMNRKDDNALCNMLTDAMRIEAGIDIFFQNGGGVRASIPEGTVQKRTIYEVLPFDNTVQTMDMTGAEVMEVLNYAATVPNGKGAFLQVSGLMFTLNYETQKAENVKLSDGTELDMDATYEVGTNSFMKSGGDGYNMFEDNLKNFYETSLYQRDMVISYLEDKKEIDPKDYSEDRIKLIGLE